MELSIGKHGAEKKKEEKKKKKKEEERSSIEDRTLTLIENKQFHYTFHVSGFNEIKKKEKKRRGGIRMTHC
jgi:SAM-dependent MidA family methyltransferase